MSYAEEIRQRRESSVFRAEYAARGPEVVPHEGKCFCCGKRFDYLEALNRFEEFIEQRNSSFYGMDAFRDEICADCAIRTLKNNNWMEIL